MAKLPALVDALARHDGRDRVAIANLARSIREAGLIKTTKRGSGASDVNSTDAAVLLMGVAGSDTLKDAPEFARRYQGLRPRLRYEGGSLARDRWPTGELGFLAKVKNLEDAVRRMIDNAPIIAAWERKYAESLEDHIVSFSRGIIHYLEKGFSEPDRDTFPFPFPGFVHVRFHLPGIAGEIHFGRLTTAAEINQNYHEYFLMDQPWPKGLSSESIRDRKTTTTVGVKTLLALHEALYERND